MAVGDFSVDSNAKELYIGEFKDLATLIERSIAAVENGTKIADETAQTLVESVELGFHTFGSGYR